MYGYTNPPKNLILCKNELNMLKFNLYNKPESLNIGGKVNQ